MTMKIRKISENIFNLTADKNAVIKYVIKNITNKTTNLFIFYLWKLTVLKFQTILTKIDSTEGNTLALYQRIHNSIKESSSNKMREKFGVPLYEAVQCFPLHTLLLAINQTHVDLIYLDVEGKDLLKLVE